MSGLVASRIIGSWWRRLALVTWMLIGGQLAVSAVEVSHTFVSTNVPLRIPLRAGGGANAVTDSIVQASGIQTGITRVTVTVFITHRWPADVRITLVPPAGAVAPGGIVLLAANVVYSTQVPDPLDPPNNYPGYASNRSSFNTGIGISNLPAGRVSFSDSGEIIDQDLPAHVNNVKDEVHLMPGTYTPNQPLAAFNGMPPSQSNGTWHLRIEDVYNTEDDGQLIYWSMTITEPGPHIWTGGSTVDDNWLTPENWQGGNFPTTTEASSLLIFPATAAGPTVNNVGEVRVVTMNVTGAYSFAGPGSITLIANSTLNVSSPTVVNLNMPIALVGQPTVSVTGTGGLNLGGDISNDTAAAGLILAAGTSPLTISGVNNTYTGVTAISSGVVDVASNTALGGVGGAGTTVANGASLRVAAGLTLANETVSIQGTGVGGIGSLVFAGAGTLNGLTLVDGIPGTINILAGAVTVSTVTAAAIATVHSLSITNAGTLLTINGALPTATALSLNGSATTFGPAQPNIATLSLTNGANVNFAASAIVSGTISVGASTDNSTISGTTLSLGGGGRTITVAQGTAGNGFETPAGNSDLLISANITNGSFNKNGSGVLRTTGTNTAGATVSSGVLAASGALGSINVKNGALSLAGTLNVGTAVNLANQTALILQGGITPVMNTATINLNGTLAGVGGAVLQAYSGQGTTIINTTGAVTGRFNGQPHGAGVLYADGPPGSVTLAALTGTLTFNPPGPFVVDENDVSLQVTVQGTASVAPVLRAFGQIVEGRDVGLVGLVPVGTYVFDIPITDNFVDTGDLIGTLAIVPQDGARVGNSASLTIRDNDEEDQKACGFGTGLTVFLLLGFGLLLHARLRRS